jgi:hypothetical protein
LHEDPGQVSGVPATQPTLTSQVLAGVYVLPLHEAPGQVSGVPATQPTLTSQVLAGVYVLPLHEGPEQLWAVPATQALSTQLAAVVKVAPVHEAAAQTWSQLPQLLGSFARSLHVAPQQTWPPVHAGPPPQRAPEELEELELDALPVEELVLEEPVLEELVLVVVLAGAPPVPPVEPCVPLLLDAPPVSPKVMRSGETHAPPRPAARTAAAPTIPALLPRISRIMTASLSRRPPRAQGRPAGL